MPCAWIGAEYRSAAVTRLSAPHDGGVRHVSLHSRLDGGPSALAGLLLSRFLVRSTKRCITRVSLGTPFGVFALRAFRDR